MAVQTLVDSRISKTDKLGEVLLRALIGEISSIKITWDELTQQQQDETIERLRQHVKHLIRSAVSVLFAADYPACVAELSSVTFGDGIKATLKIGKNEAARHDIADRVGSNVVVVVADVQPYLDGIDDVRAAATQRDLFSLDKPPQAQQDTTGDVVRDALQKASERPIVFGSAAGPLGAPPEIKQPTEKEHELAKYLDVAGNPVSYAIILGWTATEQETALLWAKRKAQYPQTLAPRPFFIPLNEQPPQPPPEQSAPPPDVDKAGGAESREDDGNEDDPPGYTPDPDGDDEK